MPSLKGRLAIVTGGNAGVGYVRARGWTNVSMFCKTWCGALRLSTRRCAAGPSAALQAVVRRPSSLCTRPPTGPRAPHNNLRPRSSARVPSCRCSRLRVGGATDEVSWCAGSFITTRVEGPDRSMPFCPVVATTFRAASSCRRHVGVGHRAGAGAIRGDGGTGAPAKPC